MEFNMLSVVQLIGGLALFIYGMTTMGKGLELSLIHILWTATCSRCASPSRCTASSRHDILQELRFASAAPDWGLHSVKSGL